MPLPSVRRCQDVDDFLSEKPREPVSSALTLVHARRYGNLSPLHEHALGVCCTAATSWYRIAGACASVRFGVSSATKVAYNAPFCRRRIVLQARGSVSVNVAPPQTRKSPGWQLSER